MAALALLVFCFAVLGLVASLLGLGALGMWLIGRWVGSRSVAKWSARSVCGALAIVGAISLALWIAGWWQDADRRAIDALYINFHTALHDGDFRQAYACMSPQYRSVHSVAQFGKDFGGLGERWLALEPGRDLRVWGRKAHLFPGSDRFLPSGPVYELEKIDREWYFTGEYDWLLD